MAAFFGRCQLIFEMYAGCAGIDHLLHQFKRVQGATEPGFGIGYDRGKPVRSSFSAVQNLDLVGPAQSVVNAADNFRNTVGRIKTLVGVHLTGQIGIGGYLPSA